MADSGISKIGGLPENAKIALWTRKILTDQEFWERLSATPTLLSDIAFTDPTEKAQTLKALGQHSATAGAKVTRRRILEQVPDMLFAAVLVCLAVLVAGKPLRPGPSAQTSTAVGTEEQPLPSPPTATPMQLLQVTLPLESASLLNDLPRRIALAASTSGPPASGIVVDDVYVLRVQSAATGAVAIIGTSPENVAALAPYLASGKFAPVMSSGPR